MPALARFVLAVCLLGVTLPTVAGESRASAEETLDVIRHSREALDANRAKEAAGLLKEALDDPGVSPVVQSELLSWLGRSYQAQGRYGLARETLEDALEVRDRQGACIDLVCVELLTDLGNVAMSGGDPEASLAYLQRALSVAKSADGQDGAATAEVWLLLGSAHMLRNEHRLAEKAFRAAIEIIERRAELADDPLQTALVNLAVTLRELGREKEAKDVEERGLKLSRPPSQ